MTQVWQYTYNSRSLLSGSLVVVITFPFLKVLTAFKCACERWCYDYRTDQTQILSMHWQSRTSKSNLRSPRTVVQAQCTPGSCVFSVPPSSWHCFSGPPCSFKKLRSVTYSCNDQRRTILLISTLLDSLDKPKADYQRHTNTVLATFFEKNQVSPKKQCLVIPIVTSCI